MKLAGLIMALSSPALAALQVNVQVDPMPVRAGGQLELTLSVTGEGRGSVQVDDLGLGKFLMQQDRGRSTSTQMTFSGGQRHVVHTTVLHYVLRAPSQAGDHRLGPVLVRAGSERGSSAAIPVQVVGTGQLPTANPQASGELFVRFSVEPNAPYVGQQFSVQAEVYSRVRLESVADLDYPEAKGIWWEPLDSPRQAGSRVVTVGGRRYRRHRIGSIAGFAEAPGRLVLDGGTAAVQVLEGDMFFGGVKEKVLAGNALELDVRPLPPGVDASQVGRYSVQSGFVPEQVRVGDVIELSVTVEGSGNIKAFELPELKIPPGLRAFSPKREVEMSEVPGTIAGTLRVTQPFQATTPGRHLIPARTVTWFDPIAGRKRQSKVGPFGLEVVGSPGVAATVQPRTPSQDPSPSPGLRGPIGSMRDRLPVAGWLAHPAWSLLLLVLAVLAWRPLAGAREAEVQVQGRGLLEAALEGVLGVPIRGLARDDLLVRAEAVLGPSRRDELARRLDRLDAAAYSPSPDEAEALKAELVLWLEGQG